MSNEKALYRESVEHMRRSLLTCAWEIETRIPVYGVFSDAERDRLLKLVVEIRSYGLDLKDVLRGASR